MPFEKNQGTMHVVMKFTTTKVSVFQLLAYIKKLYQEEALRDIAYKHIKNENSSTFFLATPANNDKVIDYFFNRCSRMVENESKSCIFDSTCRIATIPIEDNYLLVQ